MGIDLFAAHPKLPKQRLNAEERLRRLEEAKAFLRQHLTPESMPARVLINNAKAAGIASRTLHRAKDVLGVRVQRQDWGQDGQWLWAAPSGQAIPGTVTLLAAGGTSRHSP